MGSHWSKLSRGELLHVGRGCPSSLPPGWRKIQGWAPTERGHHPSASALVTEVPAGGDSPVLAALQGDLDLEVLLFCVNPSWKVGGWGVNHEEPQTSDPQR